MTFPGILSDDEKPTTALAAVKDERGNLVKQPELPACRPDGRACRRPLATSFRWCRCPPRSC